MVSPDLNSFIKIKNSLNTSYILYLIRLTFPTLVLLACLYLFVKTVMQINVIQIKGGKYRYFLIYVATTIIIKGLAKCGLK